MFRNNLRKQHQQQGILGRGKRKTNITKNKDDPQYIKQQQTNDSYINVSIKTTQKNPEQNYWKLNGTPEFYY